MPTCEGCNLAEIYKKAASIRRANGDIHHLTTPFVLRGCIKREDLADFSAEIVEGTNADCIYPDRRVVVEVAPQQA